jgi:UDP-glucose:(heptosyl)LPS alpha-1,3-glucosyltransferase
VRIAVVAEWVDPWRGGAETSTRQFVQHLIEHGTEVHVFTLSQPSPNPRLAIHTIPGEKLPRARRSIAFARRVAERLREESFDIVHAITLCPGCDVYQPRGGTIAETVARNLALYQAGWRRNLKRRANSFNRKQQHLLRLEREVLADPSGPTVVALSDYVVEQLKRHYDLPDQRICKIFNGVEPDATPEAQRAEHRKEVRREFDVPTDALTVLAVAHNFRLKGIRRWMEALRLLRERGHTHIHSLVVGKGDSLPWHRLARRMHLEDCLHFVGPSNRVSAFYHAADLLVHPTYYDPCSRVVLEALAAGLPVVTTRWDGSAERVSPGKNGYILDDPTDVEGLATAVLELDDPHRRQKMSSAAVAAASEASMASHAEEMLALYERIVTAS